MKVKEMMASLAKRDPEAEIVPSVPGNYNGIRVEVFELEENDGQLSFGVEILPEEDEDDDEERIAELEGILENAQKELIAKQDPTDEKAMATCGDCGLSWNDAAISDVTPTPGGRCPFEYYHEEAHELARLKR